MATTLKQQMAADAADGAVFLNTDEFAETITLYPDGNNLKETTITAIVFREDEEGSREAYGDGLMTNRDGGRKLRRTIRIVVETSADVSDKRGDLIKLSGGEIFAVKRLLSRDADLTEFSCVRSTVVTTKRKARAG